MANAVNSDKYKKKIQDIIPIFQEKNLKDSNEIRFSNTYSIIIDDYAANIGDYCHKGSYCRFYKDDNILKVKDNILSSIKSSYGLYLKKNVDSYIKTLKELQELLKYLEDNFLDIQEKFSNKFKVNIGAIFTFFMTTVLFNTLSTGKIENIFTKDISVLTISLLFVSVVIFIYEIIELNRSKNRLEKSYKEKKNYFSFLLDENEIKSFFDDEKFLEENKKQLKKMRKEYIVLFIFTYIVVLIVLFILSMWFNGLFWKFINFFIKMNQQV